MPFPREVMSALALLSLAGSACERPEAPGSRPLAGTTFDQRTLTGHLAWGHESRTFTECGSHRVGWVVDATDGELAQIYGELTVEPYQPLFVAVRGRWEPAPETGFAAEFDEQLVVVELRRAATESPGCAEDRTSFEYRATGNEPFWSVRIASEGITYNRLGRPQPLEFPYVSPQQTAGTTLFRSERTAPDPVRIEVVLEPARCLDTMSGARFSFKAEVRLDGERLAGCAVARED